MRAVLVTRTGTRPEVTEVPDPACPRDGVVVTVTATGVCRSDWHAWMGHDPVELPHVPGHELVGTIREVGPEVTRWRVGERVTAPFVCGCGRCQWCAQGDGQVCPDQTQPGFTGWGSYAEQVALHAADHNLVAVPEGVGDVEAAALGCRFATAYRAVAQHGAVRPGDEVAVHGAGGVGLSALLVARALGARVTVVDVAPSALELARTLGADAVVDGSGRTPEEVAAEVVAATGGGVHLSLDAYGSVPTARASVLSLRRRGRHVQAGLLLGDQADAALPMDRVVGWELSVHGTHGLAAADYPAMLDLVADGIDLTALVGRVVGLDEAPDALVALGAGAPAGITVVRP